MNKTERNSKAYSRRKSREKSLRYRGLTPCFRCGGDENLQIHHVDGDVSNNSLGNLESLCHDCHKKEHEVNNDHQ